MAIVPRMRHRLHIAVFLGGLCLAACREETWQIEHYKTLCYGLEWSSCLLVDRGDGKQTFEFDSIAGFTYQWGHRYRVRVRITPVENPPADGSSQHTSLLRIEADEILPAGTPFSMALSDKSDWESVYKMGTQQLLLGERALSCSPAVCARLEAAQSAKTIPMTLELQHPASPDQPLNLAGLR